MAIKITCDICGRVIADHERTGAETNSLVLHNPNYSDRNYPNVCSECFSSINACLNALQFKSITDNEELRGTIFLAYKRRKSIIDAIKELRCAAGLGLKESKDICEMWRSKYNWPL